MIKHICTCGYIYNPLYGDVTADVDPGVRFEDLPQNWICPICGVSKEDFTDQNKRVQSEFESLK
jgi:rubredoxin